MTYDAEQDNAALAIVISLHLRGGKIARATAGPATRKSLDWRGSPSEPTPETCPLCGPCGDVRRFAGGGTSQLRCVQCGLAGPISESPRAAINLWRIYVAGKRPLAARHDDGD